MAFGIVGALALAYWASRMEEASLMTYVSAAGVGFIGGLAISFALSFAGCVGWLLF